MRVTLTPPHLAPRRPAGGAGGSGGAGCVSGPPSTRGTGRGGGGCRCFSHPPGPGTSPFSLLPRGRTTPVPPPAAGRASSRKCPSVDRKPENTILENPNTFQLSDKKEESISSNDVGRPGGVWHLGMMCRTFCKIITFHDAIQHLSDLRKE